MTSKLTKERIEQYANDPRMCNINDEIREMARMALAAMDSDPVALQPELAKVIYHFRDWNEGFPVERFKADYVISWMLANYPPAQPAKDREQVRREHAEWSQATFGNVGPVGPLKHLSKEALEAAAEPGDLSEWADMQFLLWDAQRRAGITDEQITQAMIEKLAVNKLREWPEPKDGEPRLHIKEQPAPVVPDEKPMPNPLSMYAVDAVAAIAEVKGWNACRAAMHQAGNSPVIPGWIPVSERLPAVGHKVLAYRPDAPESDDPLIRVATYVGKSAHGHGFDCYCKPTHWMPLPAAPQEVKGE